MAGNGKLLVGNGSGFALANLTAGTGIGITNGVGTITINNSGVVSLAGTTDQVSVSGSNGAVTLSLPQSIADTSSPSFASETLSGALSISGDQQSDYVG